MKEDKIMNKTQITEKIKTIETLITQSKADLKSWANQIGKYHKELSQLIKQLEIIKQELTMNEKNNQLKGENN